MRFLITLSLCLSIVPTTLWAVTASDYTLLGMNVVHMSKKEIRNTLFKWDGLMKPTASLNNEQFDRFYPVNILRETYRLDFRYELDGSFASLQVRYRPFNSEFTNQTQGVGINAIRAQLEPIIGPPKHRIRRTSAGLADYDAYLWEDDQVRISLDLEDQQPGRPAVLMLRKKTGALASNYRP